MADLVQEIEAQIAGVKTATAKQTVGIVREIGDGVAKIEGLERRDAQRDDRLRQRHHRPGAEPRRDRSRRDHSRRLHALEEGRKSSTTGKLLQVPVGKGLLGRVVNTLGQPLDGKGPIKSDVVLSGRENRSRHHPAQIRQPAGADRHHGRSTR